MRYLLLAAVILLLPLAIADEDDEQDDRSEEITFNDKKPADGESWSPGEDLGITVHMHDHEGDIRMYLNEQEVAIREEGEDKVKVRLDQDVDLPDGQPFLISVAVMQEENIVALAMWYAIYEKPEEVPADTEPPRIEVISPTKKDLESSTFDLIVSTSEPATCTCNGACGNFTSNSTWHSMLIELSGERAEFGVDCSDAGGNAASVRVEVEYRPPKTNHPPVWTLEPQDQTIEYKPIIDIEFAATDEDGDDLSYDIDRPVDFVSLEGDGVRIVPPADWQGDIPLVLTATDGEHTISTDFTITIVPVPQAPPQEAPPVNDTPPVNETPETPPANETPQVNETPQETPQPEPRRSSGGGGRRRSSGGGGSSALASTVCEPWSNCVDGFQARMCTTGRIAKEETRDCIEKPSVITLSEPVVSVQDSVLAEVKVPESEPPQETLSAVTAQAVLDTPPVDDYRKPLRYLLGAWFVVLLAVAGYGIKRRMG